MAYFTNLAEYMRATITFCFKSGMEEIKVFISYLVGTKGRQESNLRVGS